MSQKIAIVLEEHAREKERQRAWRKSITCMDLKIASTLYIFDEEALTKSDTDTKMWISKAVYQGYGMVLKVDQPSSYCSPTVWQECERVLWDAQELCPGVFSDDLIPSLFAYLVACSNLLETMNVVFVTGNKMLKDIIIGEATVA